MMLKKKRILALLAAAFIVAAFASSPSLSAATPEKISVADRVTALLAKFPAPDPAAKTPCRRISSASGQRGSPISAAGSFPPAPPKTPRWNTP